MQGPDGHGLLATDALIRCVPQCGMRIGWACLTLAACSSGDHRPTLTAAPLHNTPPSDAASNEPPPQLELVAADQLEDEHTRVRFATTGPTGLTVTATITVPGAIATLAWLGPDPIAMLDTGEVGTLTAMLSPTTADFGPVCAGRMTGKPMTVELERSSFMPPGTERCAVLLQQGQAGPIIGAALLSNF